MLLFSNKRNDFNLNRQTNIVCCEIETEYELDFFGVVKTIASYFVYNGLIICTSTATVIPQGRVKIEQKCRIHFAAKYPTL